MQLVLSLKVGGTEKLVYDIVRGVDQRIVSNIICCLDEFGELGEDLQKQGYKLYKLDRKPGIDWKLSAHLCSIIQKERIDIIHAHQYSPYFYAVTAVLFCKLTGKTFIPKIVYTEHGIHYPYQIKLKRFLLNPFLCLFANELITIAEFTKSLLIEYENFPPKKIKVIYNGIDVNTFSQNINITEKKRSLNINPNYKVIGVVARLDPVKNHKMLFRAFSRILYNAPKTYLLIVGDGPENEILKSYAKDLKISEQIRFLGTRKDVAELLHIFDIFVLPSLSEGMSLTLLEAMGASLPIVATEVGGNPEVVINGETGYLVPSNDDNAMADFMLKLIKDKLLCQRLGKAGHQRLLGEFSLNKAIRIYTYLYCKLFRFPTPDTLKI